MLTVVDELVLLFRFNALDVLGRIRRKESDVLVGDSIMGNQWESLVCLVEAVIPIERKLVSSDGPSMAFHAPVRSVRLLSHLPCRIRSELIRTNSMSNSLGF